MAEELGVLHTQANQEVLVEAEEVDHLFHLQVEQEIIHPLHHRKVMLVEQQLFVLQMVEVEVEQELLE